MSSLRGFLYRRIQARLNARSSIKFMPKLSDEDRRRTGRYVAGGTALAITLLGLHHILLRGAPSVAGICIPAIIMAIYILWVLYSARRDRQKARLLASAMQLTEVINAPNARSIIDNDDATKATGDSSVVIRDSVKHVIT